MPDTTEDYDFFADDSPEESSSTEAFKNKVTALVREVRAIDDKLGELAQRSKELNTRKMELETKEIPNALTEAGVSEFTTLEGLKVSTKFVVGAIPAERKTEAYEWLDSHGHGSIIKRSVEVSFDKNSEAAAETAAKTMRELGLNPKTSLNIHAQTFMSFARDQIQNGKILPLDKWGCFYGTKAVIK